MLVPNLRALSNRPTGDDNAAMAGSFGALRTAISSRRFQLFRRRYARETRRPLVCLAFLLPLALLYEISARWLRGGAGRGDEMLTHSLIRDFLAFFGLVGYWVPPAVLAASLLVWHGLRHDRWRIRWWALGVMVIESFALAIPLLVVSALFSTPRPQPAAAGLGYRLTTVLGAGIYEELVFRLLLISGLTWLLIEVAQLPKNVALGTAAVLAAVAFSFCHFGPIGRQAFEWGSFWFHTAAGVYLAVVFVGRGLGVAGGCHAAYNIARVLAL
jgi:hypothetical protein